MIAHNGSGLIGVVAIGRNEGDRLRSCLRSAIAQARHVIYVDSGSTDNSVALAREMGISVVLLDMSIPFTAARARNEGFRSLREIAPEIEYVQFVDGDCELMFGWFKNAVAFLNMHEDVAVVCGRRRERFPERSIYNMLCDIEWDSPIGEARACGGDALMRADVFEAVGGYRPDLIAGEEPELCVRIRAVGWRVWRLNSEMTLHDAAILKFGQWWKRTLRAGHAFAQGTHLHGATPERHFVRESRSAWLWGMGIPLATSGLAFIVNKWMLLILLAYPAQVIRLAFRGKRSVRENWWCAFFLVLGKIPEVFGQLKFFFHQRLGDQARLIEYK